MTLCIDYSANKIKPPLTQLDLSNIWANLSDSLIFFSCSNGIQLRQCTAEGALNIESRARSEIKEEKTFL